MAYDNTWGAGNGAYRGSGGEWASRPRYSYADVVTLLWRDRGLMLAVFAVLFAIGVIAAFLIKTEYEAHSSILVRLGQAYVYQPDVGDAARGAIPTTDDVVRSEIEILQSPDLRRKVIASLGVGQVSPDAAAGYDRASPAKKQTILDSVVAQMGRNLKVETAPDTSVVRLTYSDSNAQRASLVLNKLLDDYLSYRRTVLADKAQPFLDQQLQIFQKKLDDADTAYQSFLSSAGIDDFDAEKASLNTLQTSITDERYRVEARLSEIGGRLAEISRQVGQISPEVELYRDSNPAASDKLMQLNIDRQDLLSRYKPDAQPVRDIDQKIAQLQALQKQPGAQVSGVRRSGVNPVYQTVQTEQLQLTAEGASLRERLSALTTQLQQISARRQQLNELEPQYLALGRDRDLLQTQVRDLMQRRQQSQAAQAIAQKSNDNIRIVERPTPPARGSSLRKPIVVLAFLFAAFTALCVGLLRLFLRRGFATPSCAARTLDLPVLAAAGVKHRL